MLSTEKQGEAIEPTPLNRNEIAVIAGAGLVVLGTFLPAFNPGLGSPQTLAESASTVAVVLWALATAALWKVTLRQVRDAAQTGWFCFLFLAAYGVFQWDEEVREPATTFFGTVQSSFRPTAWVVTGIGAALIVLSTWSERRNHTASSDVSNCQSHIQSIGGTLAVLGCLIGLAIVSPFSEMSPAAFRRGFHAWEDEIHALRLVVLCATAFSIVACFQKPPKSPLILRRVIQVYTLLIGICLILMPSLAGQLAWSWSVTFAFIWGVASLVFFVKRQSGSLIRWQLLLVSSPFIVFFLLLVLSGEIHDGTLMLVPAITVTLGYVINRYAAFADAATFIAVFVIGIPAGSMACMGVPNEFTSICSLSPAESRTILLAVGALLGWAVYLSIRSEHVSTTSSNSNTREAVETHSSTEHAQ